MRRKLVSSGSPYESRIGFSRAVRVGNIVTVSGTAPIGPDRKTVGRESPSVHTQGCLGILHDALEAAGASLSDVIRTRIFLTDINDWEEVGKVHGKFFREVRPASTLEQVSRIVDPAKLQEYLTRVAMDPGIGQRNRGQGFALGEP